MREYETDDKDAAKRAAGREATQDRIKERFEDLYETLLLNCQKGDGGKCHRAPALVCMNSFSNYPETHCWLQKRGVFPLLADGAFICSFTDGEKSYGRLVADTAPFERRMAKLKKALGE